MFDDSDRLDALEAQMKSVYKAIALHTAEFEKQRKWAEAEFKRDEAREGNRGKIQQDYINDTDKKVTEIDSQLKKALGRIAHLEAQVKKLAK